MFYCKSTLDYNFYSQDSLTVTITKQPTKMLMISHHIGDTDCRGGALRNILAATTLHSQEPTITAGDELQRPFTRTGAV